MGANRDPATAGWQPRVAPRFHIGDGYAIYEGPSWENTPHAHAAFQIAISASGDVQIEDAWGLQRGPVLTVPPMVRHRMVPAAWLRVFYIEPNCSFADELRGLSAGRVTSVDALRDLSESTVRGRCARSSEQLDARLQKAMACLARREGGSIPSLARKAGLSQQRLRALAHAQLGMPLARWRVWLRLASAAQVVVAGNTLVAAARLAGFSDQAHLSRQMREMFGMSPSVVLPLLRAQGRVAT